MLFDPYRRKINYLRISVTDRCNLRCRYCMPEQGLPLTPHEEVLTYEEILRIVRVFTKEGISKIRLTGGEPLVRKGIVDFLSRLSEIEEIRDLSLTTNGLLLKDYAVDLKRAGLKRINISLDTLNREKFSMITRRNGYENVWQGEQGKGLNLIVIEPLYGDHIDFNRI